MRGGNGAFTLVEVMPDGSVTLARRDPEAAAPRRIVLVADPSGASGPPAIIAEGPRPGAVLRFQGSLADAPAPVRGIPLFASFGDQADSR